MWSPSSCESEVWFCRRCEGWLALPIPSTWGQPAPCLFLLPWYEEPAVFCETINVFCCVCFSSFGAHSPHASLIHFVLQIWIHSEPAQYHLRDVRHLQNKATRFWRQVLVIPTMKTVRLSNITYSNRILKYFWISRDNVIKILKILQSCKDKIISSDWKCVTIFLGKLHSFGMVVFFWDIQI